MDPNKYYTPRFEEFHFGFRYLEKSNNPAGDVWMGSPEAFMEPEEYEIYNKTGYLHKEVGLLNFHTWHKQKIIVMVEVEPNKYEWQLNEDDTTIPQIKVKYLNEMDLLELGFNPHAPDQHYNHTYYRLEARDQGLDILLTQLEGEESLGKQALEIVMPLGADDETVLFQGVIKNFSEMKKILTQIDTCYNLTDE